MVQMTMFEKEQVTYGVSTDISLYVISVNYSWTKQHIILKEIKEEGEEETIKLSCL